MLTSSVDHSPETLEDLDALAGHLIAWGAAEVAHSGDGFLSHLVGTYRIVSTWGLDRRVRLAALFHAVYGIPARGGVRTTLLRSELAAVIGAEAEELVWAFHALDRPSFFESFEAGTALPGLSAQTADDLAHLLAANQVEQIPRVPEMAHPARIGPMLALVPRLRPIARRDVLDLLTRALESSPAPNKSADRQHSGTGDG